MTRGSDTIFPCAQTTAFVQKFDKTTNLFETESDLSFTAGDVVFVNNQGPLLVTRTTAANERKLYCEHDGLAGADIFETFDGSTDTRWPVYKVASEVDGVTAGDILMFHGRKYKVHQVQSPPQLVDSQGIANGAAVLGTGLVMNEVVSQGEYNRSAIIDPGLSSMQSLTAV
jgi:hypothetical protein